MPRPFETPLAAHTLPLLNCTRTAVFRIRVLWVSSTVPTSKIIVLGRRRSIFCLLLFGGAASGGLAARRSARFPRRSRSSSTAWSSTSSASRYSTMYLHSERGPLRQQCSRQRACVGALICWKPSHGAPPPLPTAVIFCVSHRSVGCKPRGLSSCGRTL